jgi:hypothetical protein
MRKLVIGITGAVGLLLTTIFVWNAEATPLSGSAILRAAANYSLVEKAACVRTSNGCDTCRPYLCYYVCGGSRWCGYCSPCRCGAGC